MIPGGWRSVVAVVALAVLGFSVAAADGDQDPPSSAGPVVTWEDPAIDESSGLLALGDRLATVNDSGDGPWVFVVDGSSGRTVARITYSTQPVEDVEALAEGRGGRIWVGDIGDNGADRASVSVYRLPKLDDTGDATVAAQRFDLTYRGGPRDAETLLVHPRTGRLYIVSKGLFGGEVWAAPETLQTGRPNLLRPVGDVGRLVTDGTFLPDGRHVVLRDYTSATLYDADRWRPLARMKLPAQPQGEGLAVDGSGRRLLLSSEGAHTPVLSVPMSRGMLAELASPTSQPTSAPAPGTAAPADADGPPVGPLLGLAAVAAVSALAFLGLRALFRGRAQRRSTT